MVLSGNLHMIKVYSNGYNDVAEKVQLYAKSGLCRECFFLVVNQNIFLTVITADLVCYFQQCCCCN